MKIVKQTSMEETKQSESNSMLKSADLVMLNKSYRERALNSTSTEDSPMHISIDELLNEVDPNYYENRSTMRTTLSRHAKRPL